MQDQAKEKSAFQKLLRWYKGPIFDLPDMIMLGSENCHAVTTLLRKEEARLREELAGVRAGIGTVQRLGKKQTKKPYMPTLHPHLNVGEEVVIYIARKWRKASSLPTCGDEAVDAVRQATRDAIRQRALCPLSFVSGRIDSLYEKEFYHFVADQPYEENGWYIRRCYHTNLMYRWEFEYLKTAVNEDPEFLRLWIRDAESLDVDFFDADEFVEDIFNGEIFLK